MKSARKITMLFGIMTILSITINCEEGRCITEINGKPINEIPMYGEIEKCPELRRSDSLFLTSVLEKTKGDKKTAYIGVSNSAWKAFYANDLLTAIKRFNQAWLIDSTEEQAFWGFGIIEGKQGNFNKSIEYLKRASILDEKNGNILSDLGFTYTRKGQTLSGQEKENLFATADSLFHLSTQLTPDGGCKYSQWAILKFYKNDLDSALRLVQDAESRNYEVDKAFKTDLEERIKAGNGALKR